MSSSIYIYLYKYVCEINTMLQQNKLTALVEFEFRIYQITEYMIKYVHCIHIGTLEKQTDGEEDNFSKKWEKFNFTGETAIFEFFNDISQKNVLKEMFLIVI